MTASSREVALTLRVPGAMQRVALREALLRRTGTPVGVEKSWAPALQRTVPQVLHAALRPGHGSVAVTGGPGYTASGSEKG